MKRYIFAIVLIFLLALSAFSQVKRVGNQIFINDELTPLTMATHVTDVNDIPLYKDLGFNCLLLELNSRGSYALEWADNMIKSAQEHDLYVLLSFADGTWCNDLFYDPYDEEYLTRVNRYVSTIVTRYKNYDNLIGYVINSIPEDKYAAFNDTFQRFIELRYGTLEEVKKAWSVTITSDQVGGDIEALNRTSQINLPSLSMLSTLSIEQLLMLATKVEIAEKVLSDYSDFLNGIKKRDSYLQMYFAIRYGDNLVNALTHWNLYNSSWSFEKWEDITKEKILARENSAPNSIPSLLFDLSEFYGSRYPLLIEHWAKQIRSHDDSGRLIFAGSHKNYKTISNVPHTVDGVYTEYFTDSMEFDMLSQTSHRIDIARHGNRFAVIAGITANINQASLINSSYSAATHGACGLSVSNWESVKRNNQLLMADVLADIKNRELLSKIPTPTVAFVYQPYAPGPFSGRNGGGYGYLPSHQHPGSGLLFYTLRNGSKFGQFDFLNDDDLADIDLTKYSVIIMPNAYYVSNRAAMNLERFILNGGGVVADAGLSARQMNDKIYFLSESMQRIFNLANGKGEQRVGYNLDPAYNNPVFPSLIPGFRSQGVANSYTVQNMSAMIPLSRTTLLFKMTKDKKNVQAELKPKEILLARETFGVFIREYDTPYYKDGILTYKNGFAIYAPFNLYRYWPVTDLVFNQFHTDLFSRNSKVEMTLPIGLIPNTSEVATYADGSMIIWGKDNNVPRLNFRNETLQLYDINNGQVTINKNAISNAILYNSGLHVITPLPIFIHSTENIRYVTTANFDINPELIKWDINIVGEKEITLSVKSVRGYKIIPGSEHEVLIASGGHVPIILKITGNRNGELVFNLPARALSIWIRPMEETDEIPWTDVNVDAIADKP